MGMLWSLPPHQATNDQQNWTAPAAATMPPIKYARRALRAYEATATKAPAANPYDEALVASNQPGGVTRQTAIAATATAQASARVLARRRSQGLAATMATRTTAAALVTAHGSRPPVACANGMVKYATANPTITPGTRPLETAAGAVAGLTKGGAARAVMSIPSAVACPALTATRRCLRPPQPRRRASRRRRRAARAGRSSPIGDQSHRRAPRAPRGASRARREPGS